MHELLNHKPKLNRFTTDTNGQFTCKENCMCTIADREWLDPAIAREYYFIDTTTSHSTLPSCPFFLRVKVPTQPSLPASFLFKVPVGELGGLPDAMFVCQNDSVWNNSCFYWLMWSGPIVIMVILETQGAQAYHFLRTNPITCGKFARKREELPLPLFDLVNSTTSFLLWKQKKCTATFFLYVGFYVGKWTTIFLLRPSLT